MSSTRSALVNFKAIGVVADGAKVEGDMSADIIGPSTNITYQDQVCIRVAWTASVGSGIGVIKVQGSLDNSNFEDITFTPALTQPNADDGSYLINMALVPFNFIRVFYDRTSGSGSLTANISTKGN